MTGRLLVVLIVAVLAIAGISAVSRSASPANPSGSVTATLNVLPTTRSITVSPGEVTFGDCRDGLPPNHSTATQLGYPNGSCFVGIHAAAGAAYPITIDNTGIPAKIVVSASKAMPSGNGRQWRICGLQGLACTGPSGNPGVAQYEAWTKGSGAPGFTVLTAGPACDVVFQVSGGCMATRGQSRKEGIRLVGPTRFDGPSTSWTITITWMAMAP